jgi:cytochrome c556
VAAGKGSDADAQKLLEAVKALPACKPPKGDEAAWKTKTEALVKAAEDVVAKKPGAADALQKAGSCKECHTEFRPKKK